MSGGVLVVTQAVAQLVVGDQAAPAILAVGRETAELIAVAGQGPAGRNGSTLGMGQITYTDRVSGPEDRFEANVRQQVRFAATTGVYDKLQAPFVGHSFLRNDRLFPRGPDDVYDINVNLIVMADVAGAKLKMECDAGSVLGPLQADDKSLFRPAGIAERVTFRFQIQALTNTLTNGAAFFLESTKPVTILSEALFIVPASVQQAVGH